MKIKRKLSYNARPFQLRIGRVHDKSISGRCAARIGVNHAYRFDGDEVELQADLSIFDLPSAQNRPWALQLWASQSGFADGLAQAVKVAELPLSLASEWQSVIGRAMAMPPAGAAGLRMALALVNWNAQGVAELADLAEFPMDAIFVQPSIQGEVCAKWCDNAFELAVEGIANPRSEDNLSGTLMLEVWALESAYAGGAWAGRRVAGVEVGVLAGGRRFNDLKWTLPASQPEAMAHLTLMLREWTPAGYVTRDFRALALVPAKEPEAPVKAAEAPVKAADVPSKSAGTAERGAQTPATVTASAKPVAATSANAKINVNTADLATIAAIKGVSSAVAKAVVAGRPFASLDDLLRVKGMGPKLLEKTRSGLTV